MSVDPSDLIALVPMEQQNHYFTHEDEGYCSSYVNHSNDNKIDSPLSESCAPSIVGSCCATSVHKRPYSDSSVVIMNGDNLHPMDVMRSPRSSPSANARDSLGNTTTSVYPNIPSRGTPDSLGYGDSHNLRYLEIPDEGEWDLLGFTPGPGASPGSTSEFGHSQSGPTEEFWAPAHHFTSAPSSHHSPPYRPGPSSVTYSQPWTPEYTHSSLPLPLPLPLPMPMHPQPHQYHQHHHCPSDGALDPMVVVFPGRSHQARPKQEPLSPPALDSYHIRSEDPPASKRRRRQSGSDTLPGMFNFVVVSPNLPTPGPGESSQRTPLQPASRMEPRGNGSSSSQPASRTRPSGAAVSVPTPTADEGRPVATGHRRSTTNKVPQERQSVIIFPSAAFTKRGYHSPKVWDSHKDTIRRLYLEEQRPLKEVSEYMASTFGFKATPKMYKTKFNLWGFGKNNTEKEARQILYVKLARDAEGKQSVFSRNGKQIDLPRYLRRKGVTEDDLMDLDTPGQLPPHVRCWTPPPEKSNSGVYAASDSVPSGPHGVRLGDSIHAESLGHRPGSTPENQERLLGLIRSVIQHLHMIGHGRTFVEAWQSLGAREAPFMLVRYLHKAASLASHGEALAASRALDAAKYHLVRYALELNPATTLSLLFSGPMWADPRITRSVWRYLATRKMRRRHPLAPLFAFMNDMVESINVGSPVDDDNENDLDAEADIRMSEGSSSHGEATMRELHTLLLSVFEPVALEIDSLYGPTHPFSISMWLGMSHACGYRDNYQQVRRVVTEHVPKMQSDVRAAFGPNSLECWEAEIFRLTALGLLGAEAVASELPAVEGMLREMRAHADLRTRPLELTCLYILYASHRGRAGGVGDSLAFDAARIEMASHYLERYLDEQTTLLGARDVHVTDSLAEACAWHRATGDAARLAEVDERLKQGEAARLLATGVKDSITVGGDGAGKRKRRSRAAGSSDKTLAANSPEFGTFTLQFVIRTMLFSQEETAVLR